MFCITQKNNKEGKDIDTPSQFPGGPTLDIQRTQQSSDTDQISHESLSS